MNEQQIKTYLISNWKTSLIGIILSVSGFISFSPDSFGGDQSLIVEFSKYVTAGGLAALGICSKDIKKG